MLGRPWFLKIIKFKLIGGTLAEWPKVLLKRDKINENENIPSSPPSLEIFFKNKKSISVNESASTTIFDGLLVKLVQY